MNAVFLDRRNGETQVQPSRRLSNTAVRAAISLAIIGGISLWLRAEVQEARENARRAQCRGNITALGYMMHVYRDEYEHWPEDIVDLETRARLLSWRVELLRVVDDDLYNQFHLHEAWDSPHNLSLLPLMPQMYSCPSDPVSRQNGASSYNLVGQGTDWLHSIDPHADAIKNLAIEVCDQTNQWTNPDADASSKKLNASSHHLDCSYILRVDGKVKLLRP